MSTATHLPYVAAWSKVDTIINEDLDAALLGKKTAQDALNDAATKTDAELAK